MKCRGTRRRRKRGCGGTRFLKEAGFPRTPSGKNFYMASGRVNRVSNVGQAFQPADFLL
jgi:hypothetical protein